MKKWFYLIPVLVLGLFVTAQYDTDHDSVPNLFDQCPDTAQLKTVPEDFKYKIAVNPERLSPDPQAWPVGWNGCEPDDDNDGVLNSSDYCPEDTPEMNAHGVAANGCPIHSDKDGTPDYRDKCPNTPPGIKTDKNGCPKTG